MTFRLNMASPFTRVYSWPLGDNYKEDCQPVCEQVTSSGLTITYTCMYIHMHTYSM